VTSALRLGLLVAAVMVAFAANSLLNRSAVGGGEIGALTFALVRTAAGAVALAALVLLRRGARIPPPGIAIVGALSLATYMIGFSVAYLRLDAGIGALILFGGVQLAMFTAGLFGGERPLPRRWAGSAIALAGLVWMFWPTHGVEVDALAAVSMGAAALGWAAYSLNGRRAPDALPATAASFVIAVPLCATAAMMFPDATRATGTGLLLAVVSGAVTSGLGYAAWYALLPRLTATAASLTQPSVPVIVLLGGALLLGEAIAPATGMAAALVLGGVALGALPARRRHDPDGTRA
jgi:drug/metabolite transporter (DMT)-like permease